MPVLARTFRTKFLAVVLSALCGLTVFSASSSSADTSAQRLEQARRELRVAQQDADKLAQRFADAEATAETLDDQIAATKRSIVATSRNMQRVRADVVRLVVSLYANDRHGDVSVVDSGASLVESGRAAQYARIIAERDQLAIERFRAQRTTLTTQQRALAAAKAEQAKVLLEINRATSAIDAKLATLATLQRELGTKIVNEEADARRAANEAERRLQEIRRDAAKTAIGPSKKDSPTSTAPSNEPVPRPAPGPKPPAGPKPPPSGGKYGVNVCPVRGPVSFIDSWGDPRSGGRTHKGVDMMAPRGAPNVAVTSGTLQYKHGSIMGNGIFFHGDNGNEYWYFHLNAYAGPARHVEQGEVIGYTGNTGTGAVHTHFEIHPGSGAAVNPYSAVRVVC